MVDLNRDIDFQFVEEDEEETDFQFMGNKTNKTVEENRDIDFQFVEEDEEETTTQSTTPIFTPPKKEITYEQFKDSPDLVAAAVRFSKGRLGYDKISEEDAVDEVIEHFREFKVNELTAGKDWNLVVELLLL